MTVENYFSKIHSLLDKICDEYQFSMLSFPNQPKNFTPKTIYQNPLSPNCLRNHCILPQTFQDPGNSRIFSRPPSKNKLPKSPFPQLPSEPLYTPPNLPGSPKPHWIFSRSSPKKQFTKIPQTPLDFFPYCCIIINESIVSDTPAQAGASRRKPAQAGARVRPIAGP